jgi:hypothetical protein
MTGKNRIMIYGPKTNGTYQDSGGRCAGDLNPAIRGGGDPAFPGADAEHIASIEGYQVVVPVGNLRSKILMVQSAQNRHRQRATDGRLNGTRDRRVLVQR